MEGIGARHKEQIGIGKRLNMWAAAEVTGYGYDGLRREM